MKCPKCNYASLRVVSTDHNDLKDFIKRRRECNKCGYRFNTQEMKPLQDDRYHTGNLK